MPTHHLHISTPFMIMTTLFVIGFVAVVFAFVRSIRKDRLDAERVMAEIRAEEAIRKANPVRLSPEDIQRVHGERLEARQAVNGWPMRSSSDMRPASIHNGYPAAGQSVVSQPVYGAAPVYAHDPMMGLATGMLIGNALGGSHHHDTTTIIHDSAPSRSSSYSDSGYSSSSSSSSDSGFSYSNSSSSSSSYDSGSSGGFDASW